jgi:poly(3-hydroxybutyrate) depolymerase
MGRLLLFVLCLAACGGDAASSGDGGGESDLAGGGGGDAGGGGSSDGGSATPDLAGSQAQPLTPGTSTLTLTAAGQSRSILLHVPSAAQPLPLVIALHGNGDTNTNFVATLGLSSLADTDGFVLAAPQGITQSFAYLGTQLMNIDWDAYRTVADGNIDLPMLDALRAQLIGSGSIDLKHILVFGYSQGGYMSFRWGMEAAAVLACTVVAAAANPLPGSPLVTSAARKIPVAMQIGTNDFGISNARSTQTELQQNGNPLLYNEIQGAGHVPFPGDPTVPLDWCRTQALP